MGRYALVVNRRFNPKTKKSGFTGCFLSIEFEGQKNGYGSTVVQPEA
jgi:hypothetical protein